MGGGAGGLQRSISDRDMIYSMGHGPVNSIAKRYGAFGSVL